MKSLPVKQLYVRNSSEQITNKTQNFKLTHIITMYGAQRYIFTRVVFLAMEFCGVKF